MESSICEGLSQSQRRMEAILQKLVVAVDEIRGHVCQGSPEMPPLPLSPMSRPKIEEAPCSQVNSEAPGGAHNSMSLTFSTPLPTSNQGRPSYTHLVINSDDDGSDLVSGVPTAISPQLGMDWPRTISIRQDIADFDQTPQVGSLRSHLDILQRRKVGATTTQNTDTTVSERPSDLSLFQRPQFRWLALRFKSWQDPASSFYVVFAALGAFLLSYDAACVPFFLAWDIDTTIAITAFASFSAVFWTIDCAASCFKGFYHEGLLITEPRLVLARYLRTWFLLDFSFVALDWVNVALSSGYLHSGGRFNVNAFRLARLTKGSRLVLLLRVGRLAGFLNDYMERNLSEKKRLRLYLIAICAAILFAAHLIACAWFAVGMYSASDTGTHWVEWESVIGSEPRPFLETSTLHQYSTSFHFAIAQLALGAMEVTPTNTPERIFNILSLTIGLICGTSLVSSLSATMVDVLISSKERVSHLRTLRRYLRENHISMKVALMAQRQAKERLAERHRLQASDVVLLSELSSALRQELDVQIFTKPLLSHGLFRSMMAVDSAGFTKICSHAVEVVLPRAGDEVFVGLTTAVGAYHLISGHIKYERRTHVDDAAAFEFPPVVGGGAWLSEAALWANWVHIGTATATSPCYLIRIRASSLHTSLQHHFVLQEICAEYCIAFHTVLTTANPQMAIEHSDDLDIRGTAFEALLGRYVSLELREVVGRVILDGAQMDPRRKRRMLGELAAGKVSIAWSSKLDPLLIITLVSLRLVRATDSAILTQVGTWSASSGIVARCMLPTMRRPEKESGRALGRELIRQYLKPLTKFVRITSCDEDPEMFPHEGENYPSIEAVQISEVFNGILLSGFEEAPHRASMASTRNSKTIPIHLAQEPVMYFPHRGGMSGGYYAWLQTDVADHLRSHEGNATLFSWVAGFAPPSGRAVSTQSGEWGSEFATESTINHSVREAFSDIVVRSALDRVTV